MEIAVSVDTPTGVDALFAGEGMERTVTVAIVPVQSNGGGATMGEVSVDYVEMMVSYTSQ